MYRWPSEQVDWNSATFAEVFGVSEFRVFWLAQVLSVAGDRLALVALTVLVFDRTHSPLLTVGDRPSTSARTPILRVALGRRISLKCSMRTAASRTAALWREGGVCSDEVRGDSRIHGVVVFTDRLEQDAPCGARRWRTRSASQRRSSRSARGRVRRESCGRRGGDSRRRREVHVVVRGLSAAGGRRDALAASRRRTVGDIDARPALEFIGPSAKGFVPLRVARGAHRRPVGGTPSASQAGRGATVPGGIRSWNSCTRPELEDTQSVRKRGGDDGGPGREAIELKTAQLPLDVFLWASLASMAVSLVSTLRPQDVSTSGISSAMGADPAGAGAHNKIARSRATTGLPATATSRTTSDPPETS